MNMIKSVIPFDLLVDTDMGLIKYIQFTCQGDDLYYPGILSMIGKEYTEVIQCTLTHRPFSNPLSAIVKKENMIKCDPDKLLINFFSNHQEEILRLSTSTALMNVVCKSLFVAESLQFDVLCKSESEKTELKRRFKKRFQTAKVPANIIVGTEKDIDIKEHGNFYVKNVKDIDKYHQPLGGKNIIIGDYDYNKEFMDGKYSELPIMEVIQKYISNNKISFIDVYPKDIENSAVG